MSDAETLAGQFKREERYIVVKRKHLDRMTELALRTGLNGYGVKTVDCVVVERDWPEYEAVWQMIEDRVTGATPPAEPRPTDDPWNPLEGYRAAVGYIVSDSWDGCSDCIEVLRMARATDVDWSWTPDQVAVALKRLRARAGYAEMLDGPTKAEPRTGASVDAMLVDEVRELAVRDIQRTQTDFLGRMAQTLCEYEGFWDEYPDGECEGDEATNALDAVKSLAGLALAQAAMMAHPSDPVAALAQAAQPAEVVDGLADRALFLIRQMAGAKCKNKYPTGIISRSGRAHYDEARRIAAALTENSSG